MDLVLITAGPKGNARAPCTLSLVAKDGVYLMQIPRPVDDLVLAAGNRHAAFVLVILATAAAMQRQRALWPCEPITQCCSLGLFVRGLESRCAWLEAGSETAPL